MRQKPVQPASGGSAYERRRLEALRSYCVLDSGREPGFDGITQLAARICAVPIALISLVDEKRLYFKSAQGLDVLELPAPGASFCGHAIRQREVFHVRDARRDPRFAEHPIVAGPPNVVFYAGAPLVNDAGYALGTLCVLDHVPRALNAARREMMEILARQVVMQLELRNEGARDVLTGLYNRRQMLDTLARELARARRNGTRVSLGLIDVDHFKRFNDTYGHAAGDRVLEASGKLLAAQVRNDDVACRFGGEELAVILPGSKLADATRRIEQVAHKFRTMKVRMGRRDLPGITVSAGVAEFPRHGDTLESLLAAADAAMYQAKAGGRDRVVQAATASAASKP
jgi:diguanylate cyclase (GGDEF)-like protein